MELYFPKLNADAIRISAQVSADQIIGIRKRNKKNIKIFAKTADVVLRALVIQTKDSVVENATAIMKGELIIAKNKEELGFLTEKALAKQLLIMELITQEQYSKIVQMLIEEYKPLVGSLYEADLSAEHTEKSESE